MQIMFDPNDADERAAVLNLIGDHEDTPVADKPAPAKKATARKTAAPKPDPEPEDTGDDLLGGGGPTKEDAVKRATELVEAKKIAEVREALKAVGAKRVTDLKDDQVEEFLSSLADA